MLRDGEKRQRPPFPIGGGAPGPAVNGARSTTRRQCLVVLLERRGHGLPTLSRAVASVGGSAGAPEKLN